MSWGKYEEVMMDEQEQDEVYMVVELCMLLILGHALLTVIIV